MPDPAWSSSPPEANYLRLAGGGAAGTATTIANALAWQVLMGGTEAGFSVSALNAAITSMDFEGVGGSSSTTAISGLNDTLQLLAGWVQEKPPIAIGAVSAYETAVSSMIPAAVSLANRAEQAADVAINPVVLGALTPAIVALDAEYFGEHWPHNSAAGVAYGAALTALIGALAVPPPASPPGASAAAPATAAAAVAQTAGQVAAGEAMKESGQAFNTAADGATAPVGAATQVASAAAQPLQAALASAQPVIGMFQVPAQALQALSGLPQAMLSPAESGLDGVTATGHVVAPGMVPAGNLPGVGIGGNVGGAGVGSGGPGSLGVPGTGLTNYTRPTSSFPPGESGRPVGLKTGLLSAAAQRGPTTTSGPGIGGTAIAPAQAGMLRQAKAEAASGGVIRARVVMPGEGEFARRDS